MLGSRFKILLADTGLSPEDAGKLLHVTPRTIRYWISGQVTVPYAAYRLVRVLRLFELPCEGWDGWHMHSGRLWSPEGFGFTPRDSSWWGLLVRKAALFQQMYDRDRQLDVLMQRLEAGSRLPAPDRTAAAGLPGLAAGVPSGTAGRAAQPPGLDLSLRHFGTKKEKTEETCGFQPVPENPQFVTNPEGGQK